MHVHHVEEPGPQGPTPVLFIHGALCDHRDWRHQLAHFAGRRRVVALDLPGHGRSPVASASQVGVLPSARAVVDVCEQLRLQRVVLVGHSMGCRVALQASLALGERVGALVFVDGAYLAPRLLGDIPDNEREQMVQAARARAAALDASGDRLARFRRGFGQMFFDARFDAERDRMIERAFALPEHVTGALMADFAAWDLLHLEDALHAVRAPVLAIACTFMDSENRRVPLARGQTTPWLDALAARCPQARIERYEGCGHFPMIEQPARMNAQLERLLASIEGADQGLFTPCLPDPEGMGPRHRRGTAPR